MEKQKPQRVFHPFLFALYPILALLAFNLNEIAPALILRSVVLTLLLTAVLFLGLRWFLKDSHKAGLLVSGYLILFFGYGHVANAIRDSLTADSFIRDYDVDRYVTSLWAIIFILGTWGTWRVLKREIKGVSTFLNVVAATALIWPLYQMGAFAVSTLNQAPASPSTAAAVPTLPSSTPRPDIYYIMMDAYTSAEVLGQIYEYDNSEFLDFLTDNGFYVAADSHSNYGQTRLSLSSTLNMRYLDDLTAQLGADSEDRNPLTALIQESEVEAFLRAQGYKTVAIDSGFPATDLKSADVYFSSHAGMINTFEAGLLQNSFVGGVLGPNLEFELKRQRIHYIFDTLPAIPAIPGPKFVFIHVLSPHVPIVFGPNGEALTPVRAFDLGATETLDFAFDTYIEGYRGEVIYMNRLLQEAITQILATSATPPIIFLQGDHGARAYLNYYSADNTCMKERFSILNAYYLPGEGAAAPLYASMTPVNSFRAVLSTYFGADLPLLADKSYFTLWNRPYDFIDVTDRLDVSCDDSD